ncbi:hypothetical protein FHS42_007204 [Streptomyces zagrosensis]|uniref:Uncharacterized protein n=1 Tax=Streptomyces zagrosensis TaxID=1042984 RepID=A0A7W9QGZ4_9ACTN|nr:hypothetical protein [Streptomyces zagrosensis]
MEGEAEAAKPAEALAERAEATRRVEQLRARVVSSARYQEGETPAEDAAQLLAETSEVLSALETLIRRINRTAATVEMSPDGTLTDALARRDVLRLRHSVVTAVAGSGERGYSTMDNGDPRTTGGVRIHSNPLFTRRTDALRRWTPTALPRTVTMAGVPIDMLQRSLPAFARLAARANGTGEPVHAHYDLYVVCRLCMLRHGIHEPVLAHMAPALRLCHGHAVWLDAACHPHVGAISTD